jgi:hypothetical protein
MYKGFIFNLQTYRDLEVKPFGSCQRVDVFPGDIKGIPGSDLGGKSFFRARSAFTRGTD